MASRLHQDYTAEEKSRWVSLRSMEWDSYPAFLSPLYGIFIVYFYGWWQFIIFLVIATFIWKIFIMKKFLSIYLLDLMAIVVNVLKWPLAVVFAAIAFFTHLNILFVISLLLFPLVTYLLTFLELPYNIGGMSKSAKHNEEIIMRIMNKL